MELKNITVLSIMEHSYIFLNRTCESSVEMDDVTRRHGNESPSADTDGSVAVAAIAAR